jgi:hypothetical protein
VVAIARPKAEEPQLSLQSDDLRRHWLGLVDWQRLSPALRGLEVSPVELHQQWHELLSQMEADGDFDSKPKLAELEYEVKWLEKYKDQIVQDYRGAIRNAAATWPELGPLADRVEPDLRKNPSQGFAWLGLRLSIDREQVNEVWIGIRPGYLSTPTVEVGWYQFASVPPRLRATLRAAEHRLIDQKFTERFTPNLQFTSNISGTKIMTRPPIGSAEVRRDPDNARRRAIRGGLEAIASSGVLQVEASLVAAA